MTRKKSLNHMQLDVLNYRATLDDKNTQTLQKLENGYEGELLFDQVLEQYKNQYDLIHVKDFLFKYDGGSKEIQIDNIVISHDVCYIFEVKKFGFNLVLDERNMFFYEDGRECTMLNNQSERQIGTMRQLLSECGYPMAINHRMVFINPNQTVYGVKKDSPILLPNTMKRFLDHHMKPNRKDYRFLEDALNERRLARSKHDTFYEIDLDVLRKGVYCADCATRMIRSSRYKYSCNGCDARISTLDAIRRLIHDIRVLNPDYRLTSQFLSRLSGGEISGSAIRKYRLRGSIEY